MAPLHTSHMRNLVTIDRRAADHTAKWRLARRCSPDLAPALTPVFPVSGHAPRLPAHRRLLIRALALWRNRQSATRWLMTQSFSPAWLPARLRRPATGYVVALVLQILAVAYTSALMLALPGFAFPGLLSVLGIVLIALAFGPGPSLLAALLGSVMIDFFVLPPAFHFPVSPAGKLVSFMLYLLVGVAISLIAGQVERGRRLAERLTAQVAAQASQTLALQHERYTHEREAAQARMEALEASRRQMDEFLALASHELRTPLTVAMASMQIVRRQAHAASRLLAEVDTHMAHGSALAPQSTAEAQESAQKRATAERKLTDITTLLDRSDAALARLNRLVGDLLDASRIEAGTFVLNQQACDLSALMREAVAEQRRAWPKREILLSLPDGEAHAWGDPQRLKQVATIFLSNALKFAPPARPVWLTLERVVAPTVAPLADSAAAHAVVGPTESYCAGAWARIAVADEGPGLSPEQQAQVWGRFARVAGIEQQQGSGIGVGLGLYIAQAIAARHGGRLGVESALGKGSTFWCEAPILTPLQDNRGDTDDEAITPGMAHGAADEEPERSPLDARA